MRNKQGRLDLNKTLYRKLYLIRSAENAIIAHYPENEMKTPMHMSLGSEAIAVGVCTALGKQGQFFCSYRSHAVYLANTGETDAFFAELYGKSTGAVRGRGGSMHLSSPETGFLGSSAIVASTLPPAVGAAFANKVQNNGKIIAVFFGDGAVDEGNFWESLNLASVMKLPILFVCEDNGFAVHTPTSQRHGYKSLPRIVRGFQCAVFEDDSTDVEIIFNLARSAISKMRKTKKPSFLYLRYYRYLQHAGVNQDFDAGYRSREKYKRWLEVDPVDIQRKKLIKLGKSENEIKRLEKQITFRVENSIVKAKSAPFPDQKELFDDSEFKFSREE
ncbi:MAG: thiamine pyrophosphate-dependent dehydrogenase E1 component subunit alpha [Patescibacteria group bacterium]